MYFFWKTMAAPEREETIWKKVKNDDFLKSLFLSGYIIDNGKTKCYTCGSCCGQCGDDLSGLTREEYERKFSDKSL